MISELSKAAIEAREKAYCKYSSYAVGAAVLTKSGKIYKGCNIENVSFGATICAERVAMSKAISEGDREFVSIAITGGKDKPGFASPCGICRQFMVEFCDKNFKIILTDGQEDKEYTLGELLSLSFDSLN